MDWFNTGLYRDLEYGMVYPQVLPRHKREDAAVQQANLDYIAWPNVSRWIATMKARPSRGQVNEGFYTYFVGPHRGAAFAGL